MTAEIIKLEEQRIKELRKEKRDLWADKQTKVHIMAVTEKEREKGRLFAEIMAENLPNLRKYINL